jgi:hypothetical protein
MFPKLRPWSQRAVILARRGKIGACAFSVLRTVVMALSEVKLWRRLPQGLGLAAFPGLRCPSVCPLRRPLLLVIRLLLLVRVLPRVVENNRDALATVVCQLVVGERLFGERGAMGPGAWREPDANASSGRSLNWISGSPCACVRACVRVCVRTCVRACSCVRARVRACGRAGGRHEFGQVRCRQLPLAAWLP